MPGSELIGEEEKSAINEIFDNGGMLYRYGFDNPEDSKVYQFEQKIAKYVGCKYAHAVNSGTAALKCAIYGMGIKPGDEVILPAFTFVATAEAVVELGAVPIIADIDTTLTIDTDDIQRLISDKTKLIIPVHMMGGSSNMKTINEIANDYNILVLEDSAQAFGAIYSNKHLGTLGDAGIYSFDYGKTITSGEGGMIVTNNHHIYQKAREYSDHGHEMNQKFPRGKDTRNAPGFNHRMMELQGAIGIAQMSKIDMILSLQRQNFIKIATELYCEDQYIKIRHGYSRYRDQETCDTMIFDLEDASAAQRAAADLITLGMSTKNLPEALSWHFAGYWSHILKNYSIYNVPQLQRKWPIAQAILSRSVAIPVNVKMDTTKTIDAIKKCLTKLT